MHNKSRRTFFQQTALGLSALQIAKVNAMSNVLLDGGDQGLGAAFKDHFKLGVAVSSADIAQNNQQALGLIANEFTTITPENLLKWENIKPNGNWDWTLADPYVNFGEENNLYTVGHTLVWHSQIPQNVFFDGEQKLLNRSALLEKMREHIMTLVGRYRGRIHAWDVVNEAIDEGNGWRRSFWHDIIGDDFMANAFHFAHEADPQARLLYNDYNMHNPAKREFLVKLFRQYLDDGVPIHGVGLQGHIGLDSPDLEEFEKSIAAYAELGLEVHITEMDVDVLPSPYQISSAEVSNRFAYKPEMDPYIDGLPLGIEQQLADRYEELFTLFLKYESSIARVCLWGLADAFSWKNDFPIPGRTNYPLLFDREMMPKQAYYRLLDMIKL